MADGRAGARRTFLADWGASAGDDPRDPVTWQKASPHWDAQRREEMELVAGSPGFTSQWLNMWPDSGEPWRWLSKADTDRARRSVGWPADEVGVVGLESRWNPSEEALPGRWAVAVAWPSAGGMASVVRRVDTLAQAVELAGSRRIVAHKSVVEQLAAIGRGWRVAPIEGMGSRSSGETLAALIRADGLRIAGIEDATWAALRIYPSDAGDVLDARRSPADIASIKALAYAVQAASKQSASGPVLVA